MNFIKSFRGTSVICIKVNLFSTDSQKGRICRPKGYSVNQRCKVLIVGGGTGGCAMAAKLSSKLGPKKVYVVEPAEFHYYQPMFTLIGGGMRRLKNSYRLMKDVLPKNVKWVNEKAVDFQPDYNRVIVSSGNEICYDILLLATGLQLNYNKIPGLVEALSIPHGKVCSIYSPKYVDRTFENLKNIQCGDALFTYPLSPVKCPGAPQKIVYIADHYFRKSKKRKNINLCYNTPLGVIFGVKHYANALWKVVESRNIGVNLRKNLIRVNPDKNTAVFQDLDNPPQSCEKEFSMLHVVPPMSTPDELKKCKKLVNQAGFVEVNQYTLQHCQYKNVFAIGDCSSCPNSKTAASAAAQSPVVFQNIISVLEGKEVKAKYNGYASCPLVTGYSKCIMAEFDYSLTPVETFPFEQNKERYSMFFVKKHILPFVYWHYMVKGSWNGPAALRQIMSNFKFGRKEYEKS